MNRYFLAALLLCALISHSFAQTAVPKPTPFEEFAGGTNAAVSFELKIGVIESSDANVTLNALVIEDTADLSREMRGVRVDLADNSGMDKVYLDESQFDELLRELARMEAIISRPKREGGAVYTIHGTASCWMPEPAYRILCPGYRVGPGWFGFTLAAYGGHTFELPEHTPSEFAKLLKSAAEELDDR